MDSVPFYATRVIYFNPRSSSLARSSEREVNRDTEKPKQGEFSLNTRVKTVDLEFPT